MSLLYKKLPSRTTEDTVIWLLGTYNEYVCREAIEKKRVIKEQELRGHLRQCFMAYNQKRLRPLYLPGL